MHFPEILLVIAQVDRNLSPIQPTFSVITRGRFNLLLNVRHDLVHFLPNGKTRMPKILNLVSPNTSDIDHLRNGGVNIIITRLQISVPIEHRHWNFCQT